MKKTRLGISALVLCLVSSLAFSFGQYASEFLQTFLIPLAICASTVGVCIAAVFFHTLLTDGKEFPKALLGFILTTIGFLALSGCAWAVLLTKIIKNDILNMITFAVALSCAVWFASFLIITLRYSGDIGRDYLTSIRVYVINNIILGLAFAGIGLYFALLGNWNILVAIVVFVTYIPASVISLIGAFIYYLFTSRKINQETDSKK